MKAKGKGYHARNTKPLIGGWLQLFMQMCKIFFLFFQEYFSFRNSTFAFKNYSWEFQTALLLLNVYYLRWIFRPANTNQVRCFKLLDNRWPWCQRLFMRGFRFRSILYSERCAQICLAPSQNLNVWRPNIRVFFLWTYFLVTCPRLDPNDGITARGCACMSPEETVVVFVQCFLLM